MRTSSLNLGYSNGLDPVFDFVPLGYDLTVSNARLIIRKDGLSLYESSAGITVIDVELINDLWYRDGTVIAAGTTVKALRVAPDLSAVSPSLNDPDNKVAKSYQYGLYIDDSWGLQGLLTVWPDTGNIRCSHAVTGINCGHVQVAVNVTGVVNDTPGPAGPAGPWNINEQVLSSSSTPDLDQNFYTLLAGGGDIVISSPDPELAYGTGGTVRTLSRPIGDTVGTVGLSGWGLPDIFYLLPGESLLAVVNLVAGVYAWSLHNAGPDVIFTLPPDVINGGTY